MKVNKNLSIFFRPNYESQRKSDDSNIILKFFQMQGDDQPQFQPLQDLLNPLINDPIKVPATDKLFYKAYLNCQLINKLMCIYSLIVAVITPFYMFSMEFSRLSIFLGYLLTVTILRFYYYNLIRVVSNSSRVYYLIAQKTLHLTYVSINQLPPQRRDQHPRYVQSYALRDPLDLQRDRKLRALTSQIKGIILNSSHTILMLNKLQFFFYQIMLFAGVFFLLLYDFGDSSVKNLIMLVILMGTYQYIYSYLQLVFFLIVLPYYFTKNVYNYFVIKYRSYKLEKSLKSERYSQKNVEGDKECKICLMPYEQNEKIIVLKCNKMHNFHARCLRECAKQSNACPLCRANLSEL